MNAPLWVEHLQSFGGFDVAPTQKWWLEDWRSSTHKCAFIINDFLRNPQFSCFLINWLKVISYLEYLMLSPKMAFWAVKVKRLMYLSFRAVSIDIFCAMVVFFGIVLKYFLWYVLLVQQQGLFLEKMKFFLFWTGEKWNMCK